MSDPSNESSQPGEGNVANEPQYARVYISNLDYSTTENELFDFLKYCEVKSVLVPSHTVRGFRSNHVKPLGIAYAEFETNEKAQEVVEKMNAKKFKGRELRLKLYVPFTAEHVQKPSKPNAVARQRSDKKKSKQQPQGKESPVPKEKQTSIDTVYCSYLPKNTNDQDLRDYFSVYNPQEIWIFRTRSTRGPMHLKLHRHYTAALITLNTTEKINEICDKMVKTKLLGRKIVIKPAYLSKIQEVKRIAEQTGLVTESEQQQQQLQQPSPPDLPQSEHSPLNGSPQQPEQEQVATEIPEVQVGA